MRWRNRSNRAGSITAPALSAIHPVSGPPGDASGGERSARAARRLRTRRERWLGLACARPSQRARLVGVDRKTSKGLDPQFAARFRDEVKAMPR